ncbi:hypothetical protein Taro_026887 [Colocasia esculenta]|uniref:PPIase cyclophilin-type domain-containing protein n=1 Tax=Colocasia esculenta TaxID=4460 RepID=A0A843VE47_COLES|nr:hypothetical protein [Colocasia esculenta]
MSSVYVLEPPTKGKVVLNTSLGPLDIELWPKEAPMATRNFVQLCLEGYYDRTLFHRVIKSFMVQGGDPTGTGTGGESIYGGAFTDEFHSRLRFNHRGLVACANTGTPHSNGSQFFITLDRCDWLDKKNSIFGKVTGDSVFNLLRIGEVETDNNDRPLNPIPKIISVEVLWNPFDDIVPRQISEKPSSAPKTEVEKQDQKKKAVKKLNLLSFGEEAEEEEKDLASVNQKMQSIHDVLNDPRFIKEETQEKELSSMEIEKKKDLQKAVREALNSKRGEHGKDSENDTPGSHENSDGDDGDDEAAFDAQMRSQILRKRLELGDIATRHKSVAATILISPKCKLDRDSGDDDDEDHRNKVEKLSIKKKGIGSEARAELMAKADTDLQLLGHAEQERQMQRHKKRRLHGREEDTLAKLERFKKSVPVKSVMKSVTSMSSDPKQNDEDDDMTRKDDPNDYVVHDPLLEKGKEKFNKMQAKLKRREREWAGRSLT